jgi:uncharacterized membrane protein
MTHLDDFDATEDRALPGIAYALFLLGLVSFGFTAVAGVILAYVSRAPASPQPRSHYAFLIRTFWVGLGCVALWACLLWAGAPMGSSVIGAGLSLLGKLVLSLGAIWYGVRCVVGVVFLARGQPYPRPASWTI